ncbi:substrate import-associated zinc metallohydrolase lipoprotein [Pedobacter soli]|uniref:Substrate import-associated zinc metallohydrolase lipoprotein n=1 Tax=Pedobacter soli TaxID=390242 RepID=A0A1G6M8V4_9SPHI|nr:substrate import-associated zinc metallohydrolase lipoprotein [Pedobacter soli]SDC51933.1 substrate import-associated zinc metallohydrolase lipoprotein [Pedobacter soli]
MKKNIFKIFAALTFVLAVQSCKKEDAVSIDLTQYIDNPSTQTDLDKWLKTSFLDTYNIDVIYRYSDYYKDYDKVVSPVNVNKVMPQMQTVLDGFISPYKKVAGQTFVKERLPKEWVLYGSGAYQSDGSMILATASAGRRVTIYDLNNFDINNADLVTRKLRTIHHEFTHILNQIVPMPTDFQTITKATYNATWTTVADATARDNGYVSPYASSQPGEDFAETTAHLLVLGEAWFDARANASTAAGKIALKAKEASVVQYFTINLGIDFRALQREVQNVVRNTYKYQSASFPYWIGQGLFKNITIDLSNPVYTSSGISSNFSTAYQASVTAVAAVGNANRKLNYIRLDFLSTTAANLYLNYTNSAGSTLEALYALNMTFNATTGATKFTAGTARDTTTPWTNAAVIQAGAQPLINYFTASNFIADWMPANIGNDNFNSYGGFYVSGTPTNYFYGILGQTAL